jgi:hypothetical protein
MSKDNLIDLERKRIMKREGLTEADVDDLRQLVIQNQIAWVQGYWERGEEPPADDVEWLRERGVDLDAIRKAVQP